ncbi:MAG: glycerol-3-phosphate 1-O-acyltransferase PlsY [Deltaproteobacteria bacterium]|nr:glycerol-3-phosphate 1-O-acyltransferase PlsY [Candidatus Anaeroferrophillus wilburensis]MBN2889318.1 glycerol-3-phosphate 1-O-acyltransferase PlsY [Deltaproteobacteria bacterium]
MTALALIIAGYLVGSIPTGIIVSNLLGAADPRRQGSGNIGATNIARLSGKKAGIITLAGDALKGALPVLAGLMLAPQTPLLAALAGLAAFIGHLYPLFLGFKGGKGVATALGIFLVLAPLAVAVELTLFLLVMVTVRVVSAASLLASLTMPVCICLLGYPATSVLVALIISCLITYRHQENIKRLILGQEPKFF